MSKIADDIHTCIKELFPYETIVLEHYVNYKNTRLFFDFYIKSLGVLIEVQGEQHYKFVKHFHSTIENFYGQKRRDNFKLEYLEQEGGLTLVYFYDKVDKINETLVLNRISEALNE
jgi:very-short-patch-repair endonuclease